MKIKTGKKRKQKKSRIEIGRKEREREGQKRKEIAEREWVIEEKNWKEKEVEKEQN